MKLLINDGYKYCFDKLHSRFRKKGEVRKMSEELKDAVQSIYSGNSVVRELVKNGRIDDLLEYMSEMIDYYEKKGIEDPFLMEKTDLMDRILNEWYKIKEKSNCGLTVK